MELARVYSGLENPCKRSIIFLALTGEEKGLLGSAYYTEHSPVPLSKTVADINIDGIAMFKDFKSIIGIGSEYSSLSDFLKLTASELDLSIENIPAQFRQFEAFNRSDQISFAIAGIPSILVLEGLKNKNKTGEEVLYSFINYMINIYHSPFDDLNQCIDYEAAVQHSQILFDLCYKIADSDEQPEWKPGTPYINARLRAIAEGK
jgi:Zn-dependent M28 family amino/carboxypeptidase